jgi:hypothetical protein
MRSFYLNYLATLCLAAPCFGSVAEVSKTECSTMVSNVETMYKQIPSILEQLKELCQGYDTNYLPNATTMEEIKELSGRYSTIVDNIVVQLTKCLDEDYSLKGVDLEQYLKKYLLSLYVCPDGTSECIITAEGNSYINFQKNNAYTLIVKLASKGYYNLVTTILLKLYCETGEFSTDLGYREGYNRVPLWYVIIGPERPIARILDEMPREERMLIQKATFSAYRTNGQCETYGISGNVYTD